MMRMGKARIQPDAISYNPVIAAFVHGLVVRQIHGGLKPPYWCIMDAHP